MDALDAREPAGDPAAVAPAAPTPRGARAAAPPPPLAPPAPAPPEPGDQRRPFTARDLARALAAIEVPTLSKSDLRHRWQVSDKTLSAILGVSAAPVAPSPGRRPRFSLLDVLRIEGVAQPEQAWAAATEAERDALLACLLTVEEAARACGWLRPPHPASMRRWAEAGDLPAIRLGGQWRIRPSDLLVERLVRAP